MGRSTKTRAICWASGLIEFLPAGQRMPKGAITIASAQSDDDLEFRATVEARARHGYHGELIVPGVPEAPNEDAALDAVIAFQMRFLPEKSAQVSA